MKVLPLILTLLLVGCGQKVGPQGPRGETGAQGATGERGEQGTPGEDGKDAILEVILLCPEIEGAYPEYLLRLEDGLFGVYFDHKKKTTFLAKVIPGRYKTTDGRSCSFTVTESLEVVYENQ